MDPVIWLALPLLSAFCQVDRREKANQQTLSSADQRSIRLNTERPGDKFTFPHVKMGGRAESERVKTVSCGARRVSLWQSCIIYGK